MKKLYLLFTKEGLQYQLAKGKSVAEENVFLRTEDAPPQWFDEQLNTVLQKDFAEISVISALNHFTLMPEGFADHALGYGLIAYNAAVDREREELMLSVNKKYGVQFYYTFPKEEYTKIKALKKPVQFNFSGEKFLNTLTARNRKEIHINLYHSQCEFFALDHKNVILYNNLDVSSEVDFLYFIMFTLSKIGFSIEETYFYVYGETTENETFISELQKFVKHLKIGYDNIPKKHFLLS